MVDHWQAARGDGARYHRPLRSHCGLVPLQHSYQPIALLRSKIVRPSAPVHGSVVSPAVHASASDEALSQCGGEPDAPQRLEARRWKPGGGTSCGSTRRIVRSRRMGRPPPPGTVCVPSAQQPWLHQIATCPCTSGPSSTAAAGRRSTNHGRVRTSKRHLCAARNAASCSPPAAW